MEYSGKAKELLTRINAKVGDVIRVVRSDGLVVEGVLMPRPRGGDYIVIKLKNGYNIGIDANKVVEIEKIGSTERKRAKLSEPSRKEGLPLVKIIGTGGTIASRIDYETGAVRPSLTTSELAEDMPELFEIANIEAEQLFNILSENMEPKYWEEIAKKVYENLTKDEVTGIVIAHGTDTMSYTASALSFALRNLNKPVALTGAQRSSDRPSSDAFFNLMASVLYTISDIAEVAVVMHGTTSDTYALAHRGTRVRKMHSTRRDAFQSICDIPLAKIFPWEKRVIKLRQDYNKRNDKEVKLYPRFESKVLLIKAYPGISEDLFLLAKDKGYKGIVIEGTGMGHIAERLIPIIKDLVDSGIIIAMTTQCIFGTTNLNVYATGRKLLDAGVIPLGDMLPETALVKLMWVLGNFNRDKALEMLKKNIAGEFSSRRTLDLYPKWPHDF